MMDRFNRQLTREQCVAMVNKAIERQKEYERLEKDMVHG
jgi:hypothetical protein